MRSGPSSTASDFDKQIHGTLAGVVPSQARARTNACRRSDIQNHAALAFAHQRHHRQHHVVDRLDVDREHFVEGRFVDVEQRHIGVRRAGVVDDDVGRAELIDARTHQRIDIGPQRNIAVREYRRPGLAPRQRLAFAAFKVAQ